MAAPEDVRSTRRLRRTIVLTIGIAAAALGALLLTEGRASAEPVTVPGLGVVEVPDIFPVLTAPKFEFAPGTMEIPRPEIHVSGPVVAEMRFGAQPAIAHPIPLVTTVGEFVADPAPELPPVTPNPEEHATAEPKAGIEESAPGTKQSAPGVAAIDPNLLPDFALPNGLRTAPGTLPHGADGRFAIPSDGSGLFAELSKMFPLGYPGDLAPWVTGDEPGERSSTVPGGYGLDAVPGFTVPSLPGTTTEPGTSTHGGTTDPGTSTPAGTAPGATPNSGDLPGALPKNSLPGTTQPGDPTSGTPANPKSGPSSDPAATSEKATPDTTGPQSEGAPAADPAQPRGVATNPNPGFESTTPPNRGAPVSREVRLGAFPALGFDGIVLRPDLLPAQITPLVDAIGRSPNAFHEAPGFWQLTPLGPAPVDPGATPDRPGTPLVEQFTPRTDFEYAPATDRAATIPGIHPAIAPASSADSAAAASSTWPNILLSIPSRFFGDTVPLTTLLFPSGPALHQMFPAPVQKTSGEIAVEAARGKLGANYDTGGDGPDTFDCSGLVQWSYQQAGVDTPRTSYDQLTAGTPVAHDDLRPGDLVSYYGGGHSALYAGDGKVIHAATYGVGVTESDLDSMPFTGARRF